MNKTVKKNQPHSQLLSFQPKLTLFSLFRFASKRDIILIVVGTLAAVVFGTAGPFCALLTGNMIDSFAVQQRIYQEARNNLYLYLYLGGGAGLMSMLMFGGWMIAGESQTIQCRKQYFSSLLKQEVAWYDTQKQAQISTKFSNDILAFQLAVAQKIPTLLMLLSLLISGLVLSFYQGWILSLVILGYIPVIIICWSRNMNVKKRKMELQEKIYQQTDSRAQQTFLAIKLVKQMNAERFQSENNNRMLQKVRSQSLDMSFSKNVANFFSLLSINLAFTLSFWYGSQCVFATQKCPSSLSSRPYTAGMVVKILYSLLLPAISLNQLTPCFEKISEGIKAASRIFAIIDRQPKIKSKENALKPEKCDGVFKFQKVTFLYPKNKSINILQDFDASFDCKSSAIVGESGCGKSTIFQLMMRFYDPDSGVIYLDGIDIRQLDLQWLRNQIGYVRQQPILFATSLRENLLLGKENATQQQILNALIKAQALQFCEGFHDKLYTFVGSGGSQLSGGQKQRIAIARALIKNPKILLLDEATSALDRHNEKQILKTLRVIGRDFVTINITHRVNVLEDCDKVYNFQNKKIESIKIREAEQDIKQQLKHQINKRYSLQFQVYQEPLNIKFAKTQPFTKSLDIQNDNTVRDLFQRQEKSQQTYGLQDLKDYVSEYKVYLAFGALLCIIDGFSFPLIGILLSQILSAQFSYPSDPDYYRKKVHIFCFVCLGLSFLSAGVNMFLHNCFGKVAAGSMKEVRSKVYEKLLKMPVGWFEEKDNQPVITNLSLNCKTLGNFLQLYVPHLSIIIVNISFSIVGSIYFEWRTGLTCIALLPLILLAQVVQFSFIQGFNESKGKQFEKSSQTISEAVMNIRTILSLGGLQTILRRHNNQLQQILASILSKCILSSFIFGISYFLQYITMGLIFFFAAIYASKFGVTPSNVFSAIFLIIFASLSAGTNSNYISDLSRVKIATRSIFSLFKLKDEDQMLDIEGSRHLTSQIQGNLQFRNVCFNYGNRENSVLENISFSIKKGQKVGLVGASGCGKSTIVSLLLGFYRPTSGQIIIDGINMREYDLHHLRSTFGVVSQEPVLFDETIAWNIRYNKVQASDEQIVRAAKQANFYSSRQEIKYSRNQSIQLKPMLSQSSQNIKNTKNNKEKYQQEKESLQKNVGPKGSHVSGGQKQRIAIARAILRNPKILLLDEATSALDPENEVIVQKTLDSIMKQKTTLSITHRMETIQNCDLILVMNRGNVVEKGTYRELFQRKGKFFKVLNVLGNK